jgi:photosynthetic reaction center cytochrome c subunit
MDMTIVVARYRFTLLIAAAFAVLMSNVMAQEPPAAGATRPNLRVLQALPEAQLFPMMNLIADSLGVQCDYCHVQAKPDFSKTPSNAGGWVWSSDDKPQKRTARDMMRMVIDLNANRFPGGARISCYTCHRGATQPERLPPLPPPAAGGATTPLPLALPSADRVWASYVSAVGKVDTPSRGIGTTFSGWDERPEGRYGRLEVVVAGGDRYRATLTTAAGTTSQGLDGDVAWAATNDKVQRLSADDTARVRRIAMRYRPLKERPANLQIVAIERVAGRDVYVATVKINSTSTLAMYFDVVTGLLRRELTITETMLLPLEEQVDYDDYRDVGGVQLPFKIQTSDGAPYGLVTKTFLEIRRNVAVDDGLFRPPGGLR